MHRQPSCIPIAALSEFLTSTNAKAGISVPLVGRLCRFLPNDNAKRRCRIIQPQTATIERLGLLLKHLYRDNEMQNGLSFGNKMNSTLDNRILKNYLALLWE